MYGRVLLISSAVGAGNKIWNLARNRTDPAAGSRVPNTPLVGHLDPKFDLMIPLLLQEQDLAAGEVVHGELLDQGQI